MALSDILKGLLESGVHFGHLSKHWNPKMKRFIFGKKKNVYIVDLEKTAQQLEEAKDFLKQKAKEDGRILFVATKKQLRGVVKELALECGVCYVTERWVGGLLTNFSTVRSRINKYLQLLDQREKGQFNKMVKKEVVKLNREIERMERSYSGVTALEGLPTCVYVVDPKKEVACVREVSKLGIPIVSLIDTDADPDAVDYPIPGNDDSIKSVRYITSHLVEAIKEGQAESESVAKEAKKATEEKSEESIATDEDKEKKPGKKSKVSKTATKDEEEK